VEFFLHGNLIKTQNLTAWNASKSEYFGKFWYFGKNVLNTRFFRRNILEFWAKWQNSEPFG